MKEQLKYSLITETVLLLLHPSLPPYLYPFPPSLLPSLLLSSPPSLPVVFLFLWSRSILNDVPGAWGTPLQSYFILSDHLPVCLTHTGLPVSVSPQPFCIPVVFALVENIFHAYEILLTLATNRLLESATDRRRKNEMDIPEYQREEVLPWHSTKLSF